MPILTADGDVSRSPDGRAHRWSLHPRVGAVKPAPTVEELADLVARLGELTYHAAALTPSDDD
jgi:hypothetical protein